MNRRFPFAASALALAKPCCTQPMKTFGHLIHILPAALVLFTLVGCAKTTRISTTAAGHEITAVTTGDHTVDSRDDRGVIQSPYGTVTIESNRVRVDNNAWTAIPEQSPVEVSISRGTVLVTAGRVTVKRTMN